MESMQRIVNSFPGRASSRASRADESHLPARAGMCIPRDCVWIITGAGSSRRYMSSPSSDLSPTEKEEKVFLRGSFFRGRQIACNAYKL